MGRGRTVVDRQHKENTSTTFWKVDKELSKVVPPAIAVATGGAVIGTVLAGPGGAIAGAMIGAATGATAAHKQADLYSKTKS